MSNKSENLGFFKTTLIYLFILFLAFVVSDLLMLKYLRPNFLPEVTKKDVMDLNLNNEAETGPYLGSEIASKSFYLDKVIDRNIFNFGEMPLPLSRLKKEEGDGKEEYEDNIPVKTGLALTLEGTAVHRNPFRSIATIKGQEKTGTYTVGDQIENLAQVISVLRKKVIFRNLDNKRLEFVEIDREKLLARKASRPTKSFRPTSPQSSGPIEREGNTFRTTREEVNKYLSNYRSLLSQANSRPVKDPATGEMLGYEIFAIRQGSLFEQLGLQNGDVISEVNGTKVTNPGQAMSMFGKLKKASDINITINRNGRSEDLEYQIEE